jgi:hypothetical protein
MATKTEAQRKKEGLDAFYANRLKRANVKGGDTNFDTKPKPKPTPKPKPKGGGIFDIINNAMGGKK